MCWGCWERYAYRTVGATGIGVGLESYRYLAIFIVQSVGATGRSVGGVISSVLTVPVGGTEKVQQRHGGKQ